MKDRLNILPGKFSQVIKALLFIEFLDLFGSLILFLDFDAVFPDTVPEPICESTLVTYIKLKNIERNFLIIPSSIKSRIVTQR